MKEENKKVIKNGIVGGAGTVAGAVIGAIAENTINAADSNVKELPEAEIVEAIEEELIEIPEEADNIEVSSISQEAVAATSHGISKPAPRSASQNAGSIKEESIDEVEVETVVQTETVTTEEAVPETVIVETTEANEDEDIMVVSVEPETSVGEEEEEPNDETLAATEVDGWSDDSDEAPDYAETKDNDLNLGSSLITAMDMPDYVNDANIDSFTENV